MKLKRSKVKTGILCILAVILMAAITISPPVKVIYASHTGELIGTAVVAGAIGACAGAQMQQDRQPAVIVVPEHQHGPGFAETCEASERKTIIAALTHARWNRRIAAHILGLSYNTLRRRIATYGLDCGAVEPSGVC